MPQKDSKAPRAKADTAGTTEDIKLVRTGDLNDVSDALFALNDLQLKRDETIHPLSLTYALQSIYRSLPESVQSQVSIPSATLSDELFGDTEFEDFDNLIARKFKNGASKRGREFRQKFRQSEYLFWPVQSDVDHWTTVVLHLGKSEHSADFDSVSDFAIVDASRDQEAAVRVQRVLSRLRRLFNHLDLNFESGWEHQIWVPPQPEGHDWESGLRSFRLIRQLLDRATETFCNGASFDAHRFFETPTSGWLDVDCARHEMIAMILERCNDRLGYACRYALEPIQDIRLEDKGTFSPDCLAPKNDCKMAYIPGTEIAINGNFEDENEESDANTTNSDGVDDAEISDLEDAATCADLVVKDADRHARVEQDLKLGTSPTEENTAALTQMSVTVTEKAASSYDEDTDVKHSDVDEDVSVGRDEPVAKRAKTIDTRA